MNHEQLIEAVRKLLAVETITAPLTCDVCNERSRRGLIDGDEFRCERCIRTHAQLVLQHAESLSCG